MVLCRAAVDTLTWKISKSGFDLEEAFKSPFLIIQCSELPQLKLQELPLLKSINFPLRYFSHSVV